MIASGRSSKNCAVSQKHHKSYWCSLYCDTTSGESPSSQTENITSRRAWDECRRLLKSASICSSLWGSETVSVRKIKSEAKLISKRTVNSRSRWILIKESMKKGSGLKESNWLDFSSFCHSQVVSDKRLNWLTNKACNWRQSKKESHKHLVRLQSQFVWRTQANSALMLVQRPSFVYTVS